MIMEKNTKVKLNNRKTTLESWGKYLTSHDENIEFNIKYKYVNPTEQSYKQMMNTVKDIQSGKERLWSKGMSDKVKDEVMDYIHNSIQSWELYRVMWSRRMSEPRDVDGVPSTIVRSMMRNICHNHIEWGHNEISNLSVEKIDDDEKTHKSQSVDTIGEKFRTIEHQLLHYDINYEKNDGEL